MWNIVNYIDEIKEAVELRGFKLETPRRVYMVELKRVVGTFSDETVLRWMQDLEAMGYIKSISPHTIILCKSSRYPYTFPELKSNGKIKDEPKKE